jgi:hypothetical protein
MMFEHLLNKHGYLIKDLDTEDMKFVENLIAGDR